MRYTQYNPELHRYEVPCFYKGNGETIRFFFRRMPGETIKTGRGQAIQLPGLDYVSGEVIDRLAELENALALRQGWPDCNDCGHSSQNTCGVRPKLGDVVRINCPMWKPMNKEESNNAT